jgi:hypothetical protein
MSSRIRLIELGLLLAATWPCATSERIPDALFAPVHAHAATQGTTGVPRLDREARLALLDRWNRLSPERQASVRRRFEQFQDLTAEQREILALRTGQLKQRANALYDLLTPEERQRIDRLAPERKDEILLALAREEEQAQTMRLREKLAAPLREGLDDATPEGRRLFLQQLHERQEIFLGRALRRLGLALGLEEPVIDALEELPLEERKLEFLALAKEVSVESIVRSALPPGLTPWRWERMRELPPEEFFAVVLRLRDRHPGFGPLDINPGDINPGDVDSGNVDRGDTDPADEVPAQAESPARDGAPRESHRAGSLRAIMRSIRTAAQLDESDLLGLAALSPQERRSAVTRLRRERVLSLLRTEELRSPERIDELETQSDEWFLQTLRELTRPPADPRQAPPVLKELRDRLEQRG